MRVRYSFSSRKRKDLDRHNQHKRKFPELVRELINTSDIILEVLDARFLQETRNPELENFVQEQGKKIIYAINKTDLVDIKKLKKELELANLKPFTLVSCVERRVSELRERIKIEAKKLEKDKINVGIIGYPNTGKSSLINSLVGRSSAKVSKESGFTKGIQKIKISDNLFIFDTPGVIPDRDIEMKKTSKLVKIGARTYNKIKEPEIFIADLMKQFPGLFEKFYNIKADGNSEILLEELGRKKHLLRKGNQVDIDRTARLILKDWQEAKIKF